MLQLHYERHLLSLGFPRGLKPWVPAHGNSFLENSDIPREPQRLKRVFFFFFFFQPFSGPHTGCHRVLLTISHLLHQLGPVASSTNSARVLTSPPSPPPSHHHSWHGAWRIGVAFVRSSEERGSLCKLTVLAEQKVNV